ncbi:MAG: phytanoyl-CoA dioxygenase family protein [Pseudomonadota bacterium]
MLAAQDVSSFQQQGFLGSVPILTETEAAECLRHFQAIEAASGKQLVRLDWPHMCFRWAYELATHEDLLDAVEALIGPDLIIWGSLIANKPPQSEFHFGWHQDSAFCTFLEGTPAVTAWIALTPSTSANGCLKVLPGSQNRELEHSARETGSNILRQQQTVDLQVDPGQTQDIALKPGEMSVQHMSLLHGSGANSGTTPRVGFIVRFATPQMPSAPYPLVLARGACRNTGLTLSGPPSSNDPAEGLQAHADLHASLAARNRAPR